jgi:6-phosphogluconolactonase
MTPGNLVFVGTYTEPIRFGTGQVLEGKGEGIYSFTFNPESGQLTPHGLTANVRNPSYLCFDSKGHFLYCVNELKEFQGEAGGSVSAFRIDQETGSLTYLNSRSTRGTDPCHIALERTGKFVAVANFMSGSVCVLPILADGSVGESTCFIQHDGSSIHPQRQTGPHAHAVVFDAAGKFVFVPDLGMDKVMIYRFDPRHGTLTPGDVPSIATAPGAGPRQLVMHPNNSYAYLINELNSTMVAYGYDARKGALTELQTVSTLPQEYAEHSSCAEVQITPDGRFLYGSNRGHDSIVIYAIGSDGLLSLVGHESTRGCIPRNFEIDRTGSFLVAANQDTDNLVTFRIDKMTGNLTAIGDSVTVLTPICVRFL